MARSRQKGNPWLMYALIGGAAYLYMNNAPTNAALPAAGEPTEYWIDPNTNGLWYEFGGVTSAPSPGMRPASSYEISRYWPPVNHPEFGSDTYNYF